MFLAGVCCYGLLYYYQPLLPLLAQEFGLTAAESSLAVSFSTLGMTVGLLGGMFWADRVGRKKLLTATLFFGAFFALASSFAMSFTWLILFSALKGCCLAGTASVALAYINEEVSEQHKSRVTGLYIAGGAFGGMSARVGAAYLGNAFSWYEASVFVACIAIFCAVFILWKSPYSTNFQPQKKTFKHLFVDNVRVLTNIYLLAYCLIGAVMIGVFVSVYNYISFVLIAPPFEVPRLYLSNIYLLFVFGLFGSVATHRLLRVSRPIKLLQMLLLTSILGLLLLLYSSLLFIVLGMILVTISFFMSHVVCSYVVSNFKPALRSVTISVYLLLYYIASSFLGSVTGSLLDNGSWGLLVSVLIILVGFLFGLSFWIVRFERRQREKTSINSLKT